MVLHLWELNLMRSRVSMSYSPNQGWYVDLPTYIMIPGTVLPITPGMIDADGVIPSADPVAVRALGPTVMVHHPHEYTDPRDGRIRADKIRSMYSNHPDWGRRSRIPSIGSALHADSA